MNLGSSSSAADGGGGVLPPSSPSVSSPTGGGGGLTSTAAATVVAGPSSSAMSSSELDERVVAKAALEAAEDALESLCAVHAGTFVAVEKRGQQMEQFLFDLEATIAHMRNKVQVAQDLVWKAQSEPGEDDDDDDDEGNDNKDEEKESEEEKQQQQSSSDEPPTTDSKNQKKDKKKKAHLSLAVLSEKHRVRRRTLLQHSALLELLELPSLMDACVRSNLYDEALSIASLANSLERRHHQDTTHAKDTQANSSSSSSTQNNNGNKVVSHVVLQIRNRQEDLRRHLLHRLQGAVTMPDCLEVVTALRRLNSIDLELSASSSSLPHHGHDNNADANEVVYQDRLYRAMEVKLQIDFLEARDVWLDSSIIAANTTAAAMAATSGATTYSSTAVSSSSAALSSSSSPSTAEDLLDTIERYRTRVFEIATQFNAIFRANHSSTTTTTETTSLNHNNNNNDMMSSADLLSVWACRRIQTFLQILQQGISQAVASVDAHASSSAAASGNPTAASTTTTLSLSSQTAGQAPLVGGLAFGAAHLRDWMEATIFFASSMGRLGADFTAYWIPDIFENALVHWIVHHCWIQQGVKPWQEVCTICQQINVATPLIAASSSGTTSSSGGGSTSGSGRSNNTTSMVVVVWSHSNAEEVEQMFQDFVVPTQAEALLEQPLAPPRVLMQVPPLGRLVNAILMGLNELRRCLLPSAFPRLEQALEEQVLAVVSQELKQMERQLLTTTSASTSDTTTGSSSSSTSSHHYKENRKMLRDIITLEYVPMWNQIVIPYCQASLWIAIGRATLAHQYYQKTRQAMDDLIHQKKTAAMEKQQRRNAREEEDMKDEDGNNTAGEHDPEEEAASEGGGDPAAATSESQGLEGGDAATLEHGGHTS